MRRGLRGACRREVMAVGLVCVGGSLGACTLIAGIDEGVLVDAGTDGGGVTKRDAGKPGDGGGRLDARRDGGADATKDGTTGDGRASDATHGMDASEGAVAQVPLTCTLVANSKVTVADLAMVDAGATTFGNVYVAPNGGSTGFTVLTSVQSAASGPQILAYTVATGVVASTAAYPGGLLAVNTTANMGIEVVSAYRAEAGTQEGLQLLTGTTASSLVTSGGFGVLTGSSYRGVNIADIPMTSTVAYFAVTAPNLNVPTTSLFFGLVDPGGGPSAVQAYGQDGGTQPGITNNGAFVATKDELYALLNNIVRAGAPANAETVLAATVGLADAGIQGTIAPPSSGGTLIGARTSANDPTKVVVLSGVVLTSGDVVPCGATVPASSLVGLTFCGAGFTMGEAVSPSQINLGGAGSTTAWNPTSNDFVSIGPSGAGGAFDLYWLRADGHVVVVAPSVVPVGNVEWTAIQFDGLFNENVGTDFDLAWVERSAGMPDKLFAATISCQPAVGD